MKKGAVFCLIALLFGGAILMAADDSWKFPVPGSMTIGDLIYANTRTQLGNINAVAVGQTLVSAGTSTKPGYSATPRLGKQLRTTQTTAPTCADAGKCAVTGSDSAGLITIGATPSNAFVVTFNATWSSAPACAVTQQTSAANYVTKALASVTALTISTAATPTASDVISYVCIGPS